MSPRAARGVRVPRWPAVALGLGVLGVLSCGDDSVGPGPSPPPSPPVPASVTVTPAGTTLAALGATVQLSAEVRDRNGQAMAGAVVAWSSGNASVAMVDATGLVTAAANGTATLTATAGSASGTAEVTVAQEVSAVAVTPAADTLLAGDTLRLSADATDANGHAVTGASFAWLSSDASVAGVDESGLVKAVAAGTAVVTAASSGVPGSAELVVVAPAPAAVAVRPDTVRFTALGESVQLSAEVRDQAGRTMEGVAVSWSSADVSVATVDSLGVAIAVGPGATTVLAAAGEATGQAVALVMQSVGSVMVSPTAATIVLGDTLRLTAEALDENGHRVAGAALSWSSSDAGVARVDDTGLVEAVALGTATIRVSAGGLSATAGITVETSDRAALVALYEATGGPNWRNNDGWLSDRPLDEWYGVDTNASGRVVRLELVARERVGGGTTRRVSNNLTGQIPAELGNLDGLHTLELPGNELTGPIPPEIGNLGGLRWLDLGANELTGSIPPGLSNLRGLQTLYLGANQLTGPIPPELGTLAGLISLELLDNDLTGPVPPNFVLLEHLGWLYVQGNPDLCVPGTAAFNAWIEGVVRHHDVDNVDPCNTADVSVLRGLYAAAAGSGWIRSDGWLSERPVDEWYGVGADSLGMVVRLDLSDNNLVGEFPPRLANLAALRELRLTGNRVAGRLPLGFARLPLHTVLVESSVCAPIEKVFQSWWATVETRPALPTCAPLADRDALVALYHATEGDNWTNNDNWLSNRPLSTWYGVSTTSRDAGRDGAYSRPDRREKAGAGAEEYARDGVLDSEVLEDELEELRSRWLEVGPGEETGDGPTPAWVPEPFATDGPVVGLNLSLNGLTGEIPPELGSLAGLERLDLFVNDLHGPIPPELGNLGALNFLRLQGNDLDGPIPPELGGLSQLTYISFQSNRLEGRIPPELGNLENLEHLNLSFNQLSGPIPPELGNLRSLDELNLDVALRGGPAGTIPPELAGLANLSYLSLAGNDHTGPIPSELGKLVNLRTLRLFRNRLTGPVPPELGALSNLETLSLGSNELSAPIPAELGDLASLELLRVTGNRLSGQIPPELGSLASLKLLHLHDNGLTGTIPDSFLRLRNLETFRIENNDGLCAPNTDAFTSWLQGMSDWSGPRCGGDRDALVALYNATDGPNWIDGTNWLTDAPLGAWYGVDTDASGRVVRLDLSGRWDSNAGECVVHGLSGPIPPQLGSLDELQDLRLRCNRLTDKIPAELGGLANLKYLSISRNALTGEVPAELAGLEKLEFLYLWNNRLTGSIPPWLGRLANLRTLALDVNRFTGRIPPELGRLSRLQFMNLGGNPLTGGIPPELGNLTNLKNLKLWSAQLTGQVPEEIGNLENLQELMLQNNQLTGAISERFLRLGKLETFRIENNDGLCAPNTDAFTSWLQGMSDWSGPRCGGDRDALVALYNATDGPNWIDGTNWLTDAPLGDWAGVGTDASGRVVSLHLYANRMTGEIPPELGNLTSLVRLYLDYNDLTGEMPPELGNLASLTHFNLGSNELTGTVPRSFLELNNLEAFWFDDNDGLCVPNTSAFSSWLSGIAIWLGPRCEGGDGYVVLSGLTITQSGALRWGNFTNGGCLSARQVTINGTAYEVHWTEWQVTTDGSTWTQVSGTRRTAQICGYDLSGAAAGTYRWVGELTPAGGSRTAYRSENEVTVGGGGGNQSPVTVGTMPAMTVEPDATGSVRASSYFRDPDGDRLTYTASSSRTSVATVRVSGSTVTVAGVSEGTATISVTAADPGGLSAVQTFGVTVETGGGGREGECVQGATYGRGESCDVYGTGGSSSKLPFTVLSDGRGHFGFSVSSNRIDNRNGSINGVTYYFLASHQGGGVWKVDEYRP
ncbi:MAG: hypothetical protein F4164_11820 [Gemmatimonadales bacterium]|nr:hypothetical protein [Gemmatimonadales bacterium]